MKFRSGHSLVQAAIAAARHTEELWHTADTALAEEQMALTAALANNEKERKQLYEVTVSFPRGEE